MTDPRPSATVAAEPEDGLRPAVQALRRQWIAAVATFLLVAGLGDAGLEAAGFEDALHGGGDFAEGPGGAVGEEGASEDAQGHHGDHDAEEGPAERTEQGVAAVGHPADLEPAAVRELGGASDLVAFGVARYASRTRNAAWWGLAALVTLAALAEQVV